MVIKKDQTWVQDFYDMIRDRLSGRGEKEKMCEHNQRSRYVHGFLCKDCNRFFCRSSPTYRSGELLSTLWMVLNNINANSVQGGGPRIDDALAMRDKIGKRCKVPNHDDYETLIAEAEMIMAKYGVTEESAEVVLQ